jgi:acyl-CoA thioester hydrolase
MSEFWLPVRVYLEDTDAQGVVYNASYFRFMERARTEWLAARGVDHGAVREAHGLLVVLTAIRARFRAPARLGDMLYVSADLVERKGARARFAQQVRLLAADGAAVAEAEAEVACIDSASGAPRRWPVGLLKE